MSEETTLPGKEELLNAMDTNEGGSEPPEYTEIEQEALKSGWNPDGVEGKRNLSAEEFIDRKKLYDDIHSLKRKNKNLEESLNALKKHYDTVSEKEREKALKELKVLKAQALEDSNYEAVVEIDEKLNDVRQPQQQSQEETQREYVAKAFADWREENAWYDTNPDMANYADMIGHGYYAKNRDADIKDVYEYVTKEVKARYPEKFSDPRQKPTMVEGSQRGAKKGSSVKYSEADLPEQDRQIMNTLVRNKVITKEQYLKDYFS